MSEHKTIITAEPGGQEVTITRTFDAPIEKLWAAYTEAELFAQWQGPDRLQTTMREFEVKPGGKWSYESSDPAGGSFAFFGYFHQVEKPKCIVQTFEFEGAPGHVSMGTVVFEPQGQQTRVTTTAVFQSVEDRDTMIQHGMDTGIYEGNDRLAKLVENA